MGTAIRCNAKQSKSEITRNQRICVATPSKRSFNTLVASMIGRDTVPEKIKLRVTPGSERKEVTMAAVAEVLSTVASQPDPRGCDLPTCPVCADSMVAAEACAYLNDHVISYLWTCDTCGYGFVTKHAVKKFACN
jgi:hypothetical protein